MKRWLSTVGTVLLINSGVIYSSFSANAPAQKKVTLKSKKAAPKKSAASVKPTAKPIAKKKSRDQIKTTQAKPVSQSQNAGSPAPAIDLSAQSKAQAPVIAPTKPWALDFSTEHYFPADETEDQSTSFILDGRVKLAESHRFRLYQTADKLYTVSPGQSEFQLADTILWYSYITPWKPSGFEFVVRAGSTLPLSEKSQQNNQYTVPNLTLLINKKLFNDRVIVSLRPQVKYYVKEFKQTKDGTPLPKDSFGADLVTSVAITDKLEWFGAASLYQTRTETSVNQGSRPILQDKERGTYALETYLGYDFIPMVGGRVGFVQSDTISKFESYNFNAYDPVTSKYYLALDIKL